MTKSQACEPCAKRKVRCDHGEPCSNCKRRKTDHCTYATVSPQDRIKQLEALVRELRGSVTNRSGDGGTVSASRTSEHSDVPGAGYGDDSDSVLLGSLRSQSRGEQVVAPVCSYSRDPMVLEEGDRSFYLESKTWPGWMGESRNPATYHGRSRLPFSLQERPHVLTGSKQNHGGDVLHQAHPTIKDADTLWNVFMNRVEPLVRVCYRWWLKDLRHKSTSIEAQQKLSGAEYALLSAIYLTSLFSMSDGECQDMLQKSRKSLIPQYQVTCEDAILRTNVFCMNDIVVMKAIILYVMAGYDRLSTQSLGSLLGLTIRNAEKMGMHRDGTILGLDPVRTEERRRVWWHLQHLDLGVSIRSGATPLTLMADWDAKLPLNIEDEDITPSTVSMPKPRKGLTSMCLNRYYYFVLDVQRRSFQAKQARFSLSWMSNSALSSSVKDSVIQEIEETVNQEFLQYCDPIKPQHILLQLLARFLNAAMRLWKLYPLAYKDDRDGVNHEYRAAILETAMKCLNYQNAVQSHPQLQHFRWFTNAWAPFHALMCVLIEAAREEDTEKAQEIWDLLSSTYAINSAFWDLSEDRRKLQAAELVVIAWKTWQARFGSNLQLSNPGFAEKLEKAIHKLMQETGSESTQQPLQERSGQPELSLMTPQSFDIDLELNAVFDMDFQDIDWSFWSGND